jgi:hypothetical protein
MARYHSHSPPATCHRPDGRRFPPTHGSAPLHRRPPRRPRPPQRVPGPASGIVRRPPLTVSFLVADLSHLIITGLTSHHASGPPRFPSRCVRNCASTKAKMSSEFSACAAVSGRYGVKRCPRHSRRFRTPKVVCAAWSFLRERLTPRPTTAKSHYRLLWSANFIRLQEEQLVSG